jgi:UDP-N-acetylglucosamine--dolichyl-phosphate N-acetylglucosaminephosphotransferase
MASFTSTLFVLLCLAPCVYFSIPHLLSSTIIQVSTIAAVIAFIVTNTLIPSVKELTAKAGLAGKDLNKGEAGSKDKIPESLGIVPGIVYITCACLLQFLLKSDNHDLTAFNAGLFTSCFMLLLGFVDDVLELRWRYKLILPTLATIPLLVAYSGITAIVIPKPLRHVLPFANNSIELGVFYKLYMMLVAVYCSNTINILAGINGIEAGQTFVIACSVLVHNFVEMSGPYSQQHLFSAVCMLPFIGSTLGLLNHNFYPSRVFVGDTFTYFAGMTLATVGILGHFSKTLMLFFIPQWLNFVISLPQLFHIIPCPRHRIPKFNEQTGLLESSKNYTILNAILEITGPMSERNLAYVTLTFQALCSVFAFWIRYRASSFFYD